MLTPRKLVNSGRNCNHCEQALQTLNKVSQADENTSMTLDKITATLGNIVKTDPDWEKWNLAQLSEVLSQLKRRNPVHPNRERASNRMSNKILFTLNIVDVFTLVR